MESTSTDARSMRENSLDPESAAYANEVAHRLQSVLVDDLVGVYLHGSGVLGDFSRERSDIDILAVVEHSLSDEQRRAVTEQLSSASLPSPAGELEFHIVNRPTLSNVSDAPPFELHIATDRSNSSDRIVDGRGHAGDPDLVMHFAVLAERGHALVGPPASTIFPRIARDQFIRALAGELRWAEEHGSPSYQVLNAARAWRFLEDGILGSKVEGGEWARHRVGDTSTIDAALEHRQGSSETTPDPARSRAMLKDVLRKLYSVDRHGAPKSREVARRDVEVHESAIHGEGVFARRAFREDEQILPIDDSRVVDAEHPLDPTKGEYERHQDYLGDRVILMQEPERYINHCCEPNTYVKTIDGQRWVLANHPIAAGEEVTYDYAINSYGDDTWECDCGIPECRRVQHTDFFKLPREKLIEYLPLLDSWFVEWKKHQVDELRRRLGAEGSLAPEGARRRERPT